MKQMTTWNQVRYILALYFSIAANSKLVFLNHCLDFNKTFETSETVQANVSDDVTNNADKSNGADDFEISKNCIWPPPLEANLSYLNEKQDDIFMNKSGPSSERVRANTSKFYKCSVQT